jgi:hypothetical protein
MKATVKRATRTSARLTAAVLALACPAAAWAQCAMCQTSAANVDPAGVKYLNYAVFLLMMPPATIFCGFFYAAYKRRNAPGENEESRRDIHVESSEDL